MQGKSDKIQTNNQMNKQKKINKIKNNIFTRVRVCELSDIYCKLKATLMSLTTEIAD